jgi:alkylation response protein AidB-like acyl-CoA dehydrogenase
MPLGPDGIPTLMVAVIPRDEIVFTDGWYVQGLKATGSFDYNVQDLFVPADRTFELMCQTPLRGESPVFSMGLIPVTAAGHASWALGVAKSMLDDVAELAKSKVRMGDDSSLAHRDSFQRNLAHHTAMWKAARLLVLATFAEAEAAVAHGGGLTPSLRADMRVAATYATESSREIVQWAHLAAGTSAIREGSRLERAFRDMYTGTQHVFIGPDLSGVSGGPPRPLTQPSWVRPRSTICVRRRSTSSGRPPPERSHSIETSVSIRWAGPVTSAASSA